LWWRAFGVARHCPLTVGALKDAGSFDSTLDQFVRSGAASAFVDELGPAFLSFVLKAERHGLVHDVASLEEALLKARLGDVHEVELEWTSDPRAVLPALMTGTAIDHDRPHGRFKITVAPRLPHYFEVTQFTES
jgi:hypothetical protein